MVSSISSLLATSLFGGAGTSTAGVDSNLLVAWAKSRAGVGGDAGALTQDPDAPLAPVWQPGISPSAEALAQRAFANRPFFDVNARLYADLGATGDYRRLFALYSGLSMLHALAGKAEDASLSKADLAKTNTQFSRGLTELQAFFAQEQFEEVRLAQADRVDAAQTTLALPVRTEDYVTGVIHRGGLSDRLTALPADASFEIVATSAGGTERRVAIDLSQMGSIPRSLGSVISFINGELSNAGAASRLEAVDQTPKTSTLLLGGRPVETRYTGPKQYALKVDVRSGERVAFEAPDASPAFYALGAGAGGARLIKLEDIGAEQGQPVWLARPASAADASGAGIAAGANGGAFEFRSNALLSIGPNNIEDALRNAGEAVLKLQFADGRSLAVTTGWRAGDQEQWRTLSGQDSDAAIAGDLAERLNQLLHEQGVAAKATAWEDGGDHGISIQVGDTVQVSSLALGGKAVRFETIMPPGVVGGLRDGVFARRFETGDIAAANTLFVGDQRFTIATATGSHAITIDGGDDGINAATLAAKLNEQLGLKNIRAAAYLDDNGGMLTLRVDALHDTLSVSANLNDVAHTADRQAPGAWANGGLPIAGPGQLFAGAIRDYAALETALATHTGALDISVAVATATGDRTVTLSISAGDRLANPDIGPGQWNAVLQARLDEALNAAGVYVSVSDDLATWRVAEGAGQRLASVRVNGDALTLSSNAPTFATGGAFSAERSFSTAALATATSDILPALASDQTVSLTFSTVWGARTVSTTLPPSDPRTLESVALRLNEALAAQGFDAGVTAASFNSDAGLRLFTGASHSVRAISGLSIGGSAHAVSLDPVDALSYGDNPPGALRVAERAARGASIIETIPASALSTPPSSGVANWFPGRAFDVAVGGGAKIATARALATGSDGAVYVLADLGGDSITGAIKGTRDVALLKYDSAGKLLFTQTIGAARSASGFALAVSGDGDIAVAGAVEGELSDAGVESGQLDSFVALYGADGDEKWVRRRGAAANDQVNAVAFASDGGVIVAGSAESALGPQLSLGGADGYVRGYSSAGVELFTRQFGTGGADSATALLVRDAAGGGIEIFTGGVENDRGVVRAFTYAANTGFAAGATRDLGAFHGGAINAIAADGAALYVGGAVGADRLTLNAVARESAAGKEGFVARIAADLGSTALDRASYLGSARDDAVKSIVILDGVVYAAGTANGVIAGQGAPSANASFIARLNNEGTVGWLRSFNAASGAVALTGLAVDPGGASALDALGLPRGAVASLDTAPLVSRSALRPGDEFQIGIEGRRPATIRIGESDTLASLATAMRRAIGGAGRVDIVRENGVERIKVAAFENRAVRIAPGRADRDALGALGLNEGVVATNTTARGALKTYGLGLSIADLRLDSKTAVASTKAELSAATSMVRQIYETLLNPNAKEQTDEEKRLAERRQNAGAAPEYYSQRLAGYQAALARLGGG